MWNGRLRWRSNVDTVFVLVFGSLVGPREVYERHDRGLTSQVEYCTREIGLCAIGLDCSEVQLFGV